MARQGVCKTHVPVAGRAVRGLLAQSAVRFALVLAVLPWLWGGGEAAELLVPSPRYLTISDAIRAAAPGDTVSIAPGTWHEHLQLRRAVTLQPAPGASAPVVIDGRGEGRTIEVWAPGVTVRGLHVRGSGDQFDPADACIFTHEEARGVVLEDNRLQDCAFGIWVNGTPDARVIANHVQGRDKKIFSDRGNGIHLWKVKGAEVRGNFVHTVRDGIYISVSTASRVLDNRMWNVRFGIHYMYNDDNHIEGNLACNSMVGLAMMFSKRLTIARNEARNNYDHGIFFRSIFDSRITGNRAQGNARGFVLNEASYNTFRHNHVQGNAVGVVVTGGSEENRISRNNFMGNPLQVQYTWRRSLFWDEEGAGNYWGDYLGYDRNHDGLGDVRYHSANRMDWLLVRYPQARMLTGSPVLHLMQGLESRFPVIRPAGIVDRAPMMRPHGEAVAMTPTPPMQCGTAPRPGQG